MDSKLEQDFYDLLPHSIKPTTQYRFSHKRAWRFDFAWPTKRIAVEIQGFGPGHNSYKGMHSDYEKLNEAQALGWKVFYFMSQDIEEPKQMLHFLGEQLNANMDDQTYNKRWEDKVIRARSRLLKRPDNPQG